jgi:hypothetical protein
MPAVQAAVPDVVPIERRNMNVWEDAAIEATGRKRRLISGRLTEAGVTFGALCPGGRRPLGSLEPVSTK